MKRFGFIVLVLLALAGTACAEINNALPAASWRYKMTVTVETPEGLKTGSAVREVSVIKAPPNTSASFNRNEVKGEAVVIDLGKRGVLFALMRGGTRTYDYGWAIVYDAFPFTDSQGNPSSGMTTQEIMDHYTNIKSAKAVLTSEQYPMFAQFKNLNDPKTVKYVGSARDQAKESAIRPMATFEEAFGEGVNVKEITIEMVPDSIAWKIENYLPWLTSVNNFISGKHGSFGNSAYDSLAKSDFERK